MSEKKSTDFVYVNRNSSVMACYPYSRHAPREKWWVVCMWNGKNRKDENDSCSECEIFTFPESLWRVCRVYLGERKKSCISSRESKHKRCGHARRSNLNVVWRETFSKEINWMKMGKSWWWKTCLPKLLFWWPSLQQKKLETCKSTTHNHVSGNFLWLVQLLSNEAVGSFGRVGVVADWRFSNFYSRRGAFVCWKIKQKFQFRIQNPEKWFSIACVCFHFLFAQFLNSARVPNFHEKNCLDLWMNDWMFFTLTD